MKRAKHQDVSTEHPAKAAPDVKQLRKLAGDWLKQRRADAELSQADLAARLGLKYYTFISSLLRTAAGAIPARSIVTDA